MVSRTPTRDARHWAVPAGVGLVLTLTGCRTVVGGGAAAAAVDGAPLAAPAAALVQVTVTAQPANFHSPWSALPPQRRHAVGVLIDDRRFLVTATLVADAVFVELRRPAEGLRATARVTRRDYECNLALVEPVEDVADFLAGLAPLPLDAPARTGDSVTAWQLEGDGRPHRTEGTISRIDIGAFSPSQRNLLRYRFQGALKAVAGAAVAPAVRNGRLAGLFLVDGAEAQAATILPAPSIRRFLDDADGDPPRGFPFLGVTTEPTTDKALRRHLGLGDDAGGGAYVSRVTPGSPAAAAGIFRGDVILAVDGLAIDRHRHYRDTEFGPIEFTHLIAGRSLAGDRRRIDVWRDGAVQTVAVVLARPTTEPELIPRYWFDRAPRYVMQGGLFFTELTVPYLQAFRQAGQAPILLRYAAEYPEKFSEGREALVFLAQVVSTPATVGYEHTGVRLVEAVNGAPVASIRSLHAALQQPIDGRHAIRLQGLPLPIYLDAALTERVNAQLEAGGVVPRIQLD